VLLNTRGCELTGAFHVPLSSKTTGGLLASAGDA